MKKLDKLILKSFIGPLILTFCVSVFILLIQYMLKYFDDLVGKDLGYSVFGELLVYFSINMTPIALPLAILIASIMTYGNLGEHFELTAIKGSGISLTRTLLPTGILVVFISIGAYFSNNYIVPNANLRAYSLLYDIKHKKPSLDLKEGQFYEGIPNYSIKVRKKYSDGVSMRDIIIYDHKGSSMGGNKKVIIADSCRMYTIVNDRYLMMELFNGNHYIEGENKKNRSKSKIETFARTEFSVMKMVFSLASFDLDRTNMDLFAGNKLMKNIERLTKDIDSMSNTISTTKYQIFKGADAAFRYHFNSKLTIPEPLEIAFEQFRNKQNLKDSLRMAEEMIEHKIDSAEYHKEKQEEKNTEDSEPAEPEVTDSANSLEDEHEEKPGLEKTYPVYTGVLKPIADSTKNKLKDIKTLKPDKIFTNKTLKNKIIAKGTTDSIVSTKTPPPAAKPKPAKTEEVAKVKKKPLNTGIRKYRNVTDSSYIENDSLLAVVRFKMDSLSNLPLKKKNIFSKAVGSARSVKSGISSKSLRLADLKRDTNQHKLEKYKKFSQAVACFIMFLIGAPLGAIIKKGGLGMPVVVSVFFFIIFYVMTVIADKWAKASVMEGAYAAWVADVVLLPFGILFLYQARRDAKLFDADFYEVWFQKLKEWWDKRKGFKLQPANN
ncbi:LptF/LptG family permease [Reichenbachiella sp. MALMAid0571]|uniref:LptF/LptG family permease n=1 Tax=Reichenbachiella sp. MALMAid0571 TaxID=3143939 RepID=UPI0032DED514